MSNSLDPDQAQRFVGPDLGSNCLQKLSADDVATRWERVNLFLRNKAQFHFAMQMIQSYFCRMIIFEMLSALPLSGHIQQKNKLTFFPIFPRK